ncbi:hypothetical protein [Streptomyces pini]|uniref:Uncharacterized protein n=1 Tax=Streptomyces pini TaxID=1520580 RepID=A0A1I4C480_9ACTN|nr:hypothetical protein [Streptomyces pini]SFK74996.1 hypothetical protein SAMN05192584_108222 [Streptomyces pini]
MSPVFPHLPYVDAVHAALTAAGHVPDVVTASVVLGDERHPADLFAEFQWDTVRLRWESARGWLHTAPHTTGDRFGPLLVAHLADPAVLATVVERLADGHPPVSSRAVWEDPAAGVLDRALSDREGC